MKAVFRKEMADYFNSIRVFILFLLTLLVSGATLYTAYLGIRGSTDTDFVFLRLFTSQAEDIPSLFTFVNLTALFFIPIIGISLGFDAINREHGDGTLSRIMSQPIFRDGIINAKFLAGMTTLSIMVIAMILLVCGYGIRLIGVAPSFEEVFRLFLYMVFAIVYGGFWMGLSILFSVLFRRISTSLLFSVALWLIGFFYILMIAPALSNAIAPITQNSSAAEIISGVEMQYTLLRVSPNFLFLEASQTLLEPPIAGTLLGIIGILASGAANFMIANPMSLGQSMLLVWPHLTLLVSVTLICFAISYVAFMRREIRPT